MEGVRRRTLRGRVRPFPHENENLTYVRWFRGGVGPLEEVGRVSQGICQVVNELNDKLDRMKRNQQARADAAALEMENIREEIESFRTGLAGVHTVPGTRQYARINESILAEAIRYRDIEDRENRVEVEMTGAAGRKQASDLIGLVSGCEADRLQNDSVADNGAMLQRLLVRRRDEIGELRQKRLDEENQTAAFKGQFEEKLREAALRLAELRRRIAVVKRCQEIAAAPR